METMTKAHALTTMSRSEERQRTKRLNIRRFAPPLVYWTEPSIDHHSRLKNYLDPPAPLANMKFPINPILVLSLLSIPALSQETPGCPGVFAVTSGAVSGCCVGAPTSTSEQARLEARRTRTRATVAQAAATTARITTKTTKPRSTKTSSSTLGPLTCATWIPVTQSNYTGLLQEASMSLNSTGTNLRTTITPVTTGAAASSSSAADAVQGSLPMGNLAALVAAAMACLV